MPNSFTYLSYFILQNYICYAEEKTFSIMESKGEVPIINTEQNASTQQQELELLQSYAASNYCYRLRSGASWVF
jgi:hypothetical protein